MEEIRLESSVNTLECRNLVVKKPVYALERAVNSALE